MKRDERLQPLSREHHHTLKLARRLQWGEPDEALRSELVAHRTELADHFATEEAIADRALAACPRDTTLAEQIERMRQEHREIEQLLARALEAFARSTLHRLGECLVAHVRFEERELFNRLQAGCLGGEAGEA
ncbi:hemerythrin domain-containing protein [Guyparkeria hydrothermalis]|uniref:hemerythrin domain-containing protein n=1 Tax=Guyparkeria hydrothermalis TaxID=923 RepID=UPI002022545C|nr:hemerythrin domain-containing protein [Guyparkeria hydrothermalis]MCL7743466.1 hemerythrin domain-containing protein [Guyparkeria hydrothermalis]